ncbi:hypothetical protein FRC17_004043 [Serendipita sp. 399]|nr:hypothetical protein FRC17_004043 [Serendipita sp. 399]
MGSFNSQSSLDPYYFTATIPRPIISSTPEPVPVIHGTASQHVNPETSYEPKTPSSHPSTIDRAGLIGVGELTTPRWSSRTEFNSRSTPWKSLDFGMLKLDEDNERVASKEPEPEPSQEQDNDLDRSSPWTIEAVDESDTNEPSYIVPSPPPNATAAQEPQAARYVSAASEFRSVRSKPSADESAGEEILYPRRSRPSTVPPTPMVQSDTQTGGASYHRPSPNRATQDVEHSPTFSAGNIGNAYASNAQRHQKRPSEDVSSTISSMKNGDMASSKDDTRVRRHRSLGVAPSIPPVSQQRERGKERRRQDVSGSVTSPVRASSTPKESTPKEKHVRRSSASAATSPAAPQPEASHSRRTHDFSHLPPSPSSTALQHILKNTSVNHSSAPVPSSPPTHASVGSTSSVAHSLLRGTQEGWSVMDDSATAEALRKLDGISGRSLKARSSVISVASKSSSRPGTPGSKSGHQQWEGVESAPLTKRRSMNMKEAISSNSSGQTTVAPTPAGSSSHVQEQDAGDLDMTTIKSSNTPLGMRDTVFCISRLDLRIDFYKCHVDSYLFPSSLSHLKWKAQTKQQYRKR